MELKHGIKAFLANGLITFSINGSPVYNNEQMSLLRNPPVRAFDEIYIYIYVYICMVFTTEVFFDVAIESWPEWDLNPRFKPELSGNEFNSHSEPTLYS